MSRRTKGTVTIRVSRDGFEVSADQPLNRRQNGLRFKKDSLRRILRKDLDSPAVHQVLPEVVDELEDYIDGGHLEIYSFKIPTICFTPHGKRVEVAKILKRGFENDGWQVQLEGITEEELLRAASI
jgi:hypothetical protein